MAAGLVGVLAIGWVLAGVGPSTPEVAEDAVAEEEILLPDLEQAPTPTATPTDISPELFVTCQGTSGPTGCVRWLRRSTQLGIPADDLIIATEGARILGIDTDTGNRRWSIDLGGRVGRITVAGGGDIVLVTRDDPDHPSGTRVIALDASNGRQRWTRPGRSLLTTPPDVPPLDDVLLFHSDPQSIVLEAVDPVTGDEIWAAAPQAVALHDPVVVPLDDGLAFVGGPFSAVVIDRSSGRIAWGTEEVGGVPTVAADDVVVLRRSDPADDTPAATPGTPPRAPADHLAVVDAASGKLLAEIPTVGGPTHQVTIAGGVLVTFDRDTLHAYDVHTGRVLWSDAQPPGRLITARPAVSPFGAGEVHVASPTLAVRRNDGLITIRDPATGNVDRHVGAVADDGVTVGRGFLAPGQLWRTDVDRIQVWDLVGTGMLLEVEAHRPGVITTDPPVLFIGERLFRVDLTSSPEPRPTEDGQ